MPHRRTIIPMLFAVVFALGAWAQNSLLRASPPIGAVVQTWHYDPLTNLVTVQVVNMSHRDITAYNITTKDTYADGHVGGHDTLCDYVGRIALVQEVRGTVDEADIRKQFGDGLLHPGESRNEIFGVQPGLKDFEAVVDVVAYADQTAEATNNDGLKRLVAHRKETIASIQVADEIIRAALADPNDGDPAATAATKLQDRITVWKAQQHTTLDFEPVVAQGVVAQLKAMSARPNTNKREALQQYVARGDARVATLSPHAELTKIGGPQ